MLPEYGVIMANIIELEILNKITGNDAELNKKLADAFSEELNEIADAIGDIKFYANAEEITKFLHKVKPSFFTFGLDAVYNKISFILKEAAKQYQDGVIPHNEELIQMLAQISDELNEISS